MNYRGIVETGTLVGLTPVKVEQTEDTLTFYIDDGRVFQFSHDQDCCESVKIEEIHGDLEDLIGVPILSAEESTNREGDKPSEFADSWTWTFYRFQTIKGAVQVRWLGESNGYYSESVDLHLLG